MQNKQHQEAVKKAIQPKFKGQKQLAAKYTPLYPVTAEREMKRITSLYMKILRHEFKDHLPEIMACYKRERRGDGTRYDDIADLKRELRKVFQVIAQAVEKAVAGYDLKTQVQNIAKIVRNTTLREWKRVVKQTLGINLLDDYYDGAFYGNMIQQWIDDSVLRIQSIPSKELGDMEAILYDGFLQGKPIREIAKDIQKEYNVSRSKALFLAVDQIGTLNSKITQYQQQDAGVTKYKWSTSKDERVRDGHRALEGQIIDWDKPPEMWRTTKKGMIMTGRRCHPGEDYRCRCCALPVFDLDNTDLPLTDAQVEQNDYAVDVFFSNLGVKR